MLVHSPACTVFKLMWCHVFVLFFNKNRFDDQHHWISWNFDLRKVFNQHCLWQSLENTVFSFPSSAGVSGTYQKKWCRTTGSHWEIHSQCKPCKIYADLHYSNKCLAWPFVLMAQSQRSQTTWLHEPLTSTTTIKRYTIKQFGCLVYFIQVNVTFANAFGTCVRKNLRWHQ